MKALFVTGFVIANGLATGATIYLGGAGDTAIIGPAGNTVYGSSSLIIGGGNTAFGESSVLIGTGHTGAGSGSLIAGFYNQNNGHYSVSFGQFNNVEAPRSVVIGKNNFAGQNDNEDAIFVAGAYNAGIAYAALVTGIYNTVTSQGAASITGGSGNYNNAEASLVVGYGNSLESHKHAGAIVGGIYSKSPATPALFVIGNGTSPTAQDRKNAFVVHSNGDVIIPKAQGDISMGIYGN